MHAVTFMDRYWRSGLCDCLEDGKACCDVYFCAPCSVARQWEAVRGNRDSCSIMICLVNTFLGCTFCTNVLLRYNVVSRYAIEEACLVTCCIASLCSGCSMCQTYRELNERGFWPGGTVCAATERMRQQETPTMIIASQPGANIGGVAMAQPYVVQQQLYPEPYHEFE